MSHIGDIFSFALLHFDAIVALLGTVLAFLRVTSWGNSNAAALAVATSAIEKAGSPEVKAIVSELSATSTNGVKRAIRYAATEADPTKPNVPMTTKLVENIVGSQEK